MKEDPTKVDAPRPEAKGRRGREEKSRGEADANDTRIREIVDLTARVRHEINNPLTGLIGQAQLLLRDETLSATARRRVETIEQLAKRIRDTVAELRVVQHTTNAARANSPSAARMAPEPEKSNDPPRH